MITFSRLEKKGNLGNQLFQIAATAGIAVSNGQVYGFPEWRYNQYFKNRLPAVGVHDFIHFKEKHFHFSEVSLNPSNYDLDGWFQSEKYFNAALTEHLFEFDPGLIHGLKARFRDVFSKRTILISIRRGDFVDHPDYFQLPVEYYINALIDNFPEWENQTLVFTSDDIAYCRFHFSFLENAFFCEGLPGIEQLAFATLCDDFIISNSTFSWWCAWLGEKPQSTVIRPLHNFTEEKKRIDDDRDYFPERWKPYDHSGKKMILEDTGLILKRPDPIIAEYLAHYFAFSNDQGLWLLRELEADMADNSRTLVFVDNCLMPPFAVYDAVRNARNGGVSTVYLLSDSFINISRHLDYGVLRKQFDFGIFTKIFKKSTGKKASVIMVCVPKGTAGTLAVLKHTAQGGNHFQGFRTAWSQAGKLRNFSFRYFLTVKKQAIVRQIKRTVKQIIGHQK